MRIFISSLLFCAFFYSNAFAQNILSPLTHQSVFERILTNDVLLLGKGVRDKSGEGSIALACVGAIPNSEQKDCSSLRWVLYVQSGEAYFLGAALVPQIATLDSEGRPTGEYKKALKSELKSLNQAAKKSIQNPLLFYGFLGVSWTAIAVIGITSGGAAVIPAGEIWLAIVALGGLSEKLFDNAQTVLITNVTSPVQDKNGWNWKTSPHGISHRFFGAIVKQISMKMLKDWNGMTVNDGTLSVKALSEVKEGELLSLLSEILIRLKIE